MRSKSMKNPWVFVSLLLLLTSSCASVLQATRDDDRKTLARLLAAGENPDGGDGESTPLFLAIEANNFAVARMLVNAGANLEQESQCKQHSVTPLQKAAIHGRLGFVEFLLQEGADPRKLANNETVFTLIARLTPSNQSAAIANVIARKIEEQSGRRALENFLDTQAPNGWTALAAAVRFGDEPLVEALLANGASTDAWAKAEKVVPGSTDQWPPLHFARLLNRATIADRLIRAGANPDKLSRNGQTSSQIVADAARRRAIEAANREEAARRAEARREAERDAFFSGMYTALGGDSGQPLTNPLDDTSHLRDMEARREHARQEQTTRRAQAQRETAAQSEAAAKEQRFRSEWEAERQARVQRQEETRERAAREEAERDARAAEQNAEREARAAERKAQAAREKAEREARAAREKAEREARADEQKAASKRALEQYYETMRQGIRLHAVKCSDDAGHYYATGTRPSVEGFKCISVHYRASCSGGSWYTDGVAGNFNGPSGCYGETYQISPKPPCSVDNVRVRVTDVRGCGN